MMLIIAKFIWAVGSSTAVCLIWFRYQYRFDPPSIVLSDRTYERTSIIIALSGLFLIPLIYAISGQPSFAGYEFSPSRAFCGVAIFGAALWLLYCAHRDLGRFWSAKLKIRSDHVLITHGVYRWLRHPMYSALLLWAFAQALMLPNFVAGFAGLIAFGILFVIRVRREEQLMLETFGDNYRSYMTRTKRIIPGIF